MGNLLPRCVRSQLHDLGDEYGLVVLMRALAGYAEQRARVIHQQRFGRGGSGRHSQGCFGEGGTGRLPAEVGYRSAAEIIRACARLVKCATDGQKQGGALFAAGRAAEKGL